MKVSVARNPLCRRLLLQPSYKPFVAAACFKPVAQPSDFGLRTLIRPCRGEGCRRADPFVNYKSLSQGAGGGKGGRGPGSCCKLRVLAAAI